MYYCCLLWECSGCCVGVILFLFLIVQMYKLFPFPPNLFYKLLIERLLDFRLGGSKQRGCVGCVGNREEGGRGAPTRRTT